MLGAGEGDGDADPGSTEGIGRPDVVGGADPLAEGDGLPPPPVHPWAWASVVPAVARARTAMLAMTDRAVMIATALLEFRGAIGRPPTGLSYLYRS